MATYLVQHGEALPEAADRLQGGGIVCLDRDERGWHVRWALMPRIG